jgi:AcrR family transcriptional regulator
MSHIERRQKEKEEIKQRILEAAKKIAAKEGWNALTIRKIADEIEYTPPIVYEYFENKEDLISEIVFNGFYTMNEKFLVAKESSTDSKKLIESVSMIFWDFAFENKELYRLMFSLERPMPNEDMLEGIRLVEKTFTELTEEKESVKEIIFSWMCLMNGAINVVMKFPNMPHHKDINPRELFGRMIHRFVEGLK